MKAECLFLQVLVVTFRFSFIFHEFLNCSSELICRMVQVLLQVFMNVYFCYKRQMVFVYFFKMSVLAAESVLAC